MISFIKRIWLCEVDHLRMVSEIPNHTSNQLVNGNNINVYVETHAPVHDNQYQSILTKGTCYNLVLRHWTSAIAGVTRLLYWLPCIPDGKFLLYSEKRTDARPIPPRSLGAVRLHPSRRLRLWPRPLLQVTACLPALERIHFDRRRPSYPTGNDRGHSRIRYFRVLHCLVLKENQNKLAASFTWPSTPLEWSGFGFRFFF